jgi:hypothetical protein
MKKEKIKKQLQVKLKQIFLKNYKDGAVTYYPHGLQPNIYSSFAVWSIPFHIYV